MFFVATLAPPTQIEVHAREHTQIPGSTGRLADHALHPLGTLEAIQIPLAAPDGTFPDREDRLRRPAWFFGNLSEAEVTRFFQSCALEAEETSLILDKHHWQISSNSCVIVPAEQLIWSLNPVGRQQIYSLLAHDPRNYSQRFPFRFPLNGFETKFKDSGLSTSRLEKIKTLTYTNAGTLCFADLSSARGYLDSAEFNRLVETLCSVPAYILRLHLDADSNLDEVIRYWGRGGREKLIAPLLSSIARVPGGSAINVSYLLPTFARLRVYTYPLDWEADRADQQDCVFSALNFFNDLPNTNLFDRAEQARVLRIDYAPVKGEPVLGDLVTLVNADKEIFHACVYITEGFVFTKNGNNPAQPWVLMKLADMLSMYETLEKPKSIVYLRRKQISVASNR
jgi:hypothetical protein